MKISTIAILMASTSGLAQASEVYRCNTYLPEGKALLTIQYAKNAPSQVILKFQNKALNRNFEGVLNVKSFNADAGEFRASGVLKGTRPAINVYLGGSIERSPSSGFYYFQLSGRTGVEGQQQIARELEYGYGNPMTCARVH